MKLAIVSDIHGNGDALEAVAREILRRSPDRIVHLGDLAGYNAEPERCVRWAMARAAGGVLGNHDAVACGKSGGETFNPLALEAARWSARQLSPKAAAYLAGLPDRLPVGEGVLLVHGSPSDPDRYVFTPEDACEEIEALASAGGPPVVFFGHTHVASAFVLDKGGRFLAGRPRSLRIGKGDRAMLNPGSVGQPRDRDPRASFLVYDTEDRIATWHRVPYDLASAAGKILAAGLPRHFAARLAEGT